MDDHRHITNTTTKADKMRTGEQALDPYYNYTATSQRPSNKTKQQTMHTTYPRAQSAPPNQQRHVRRPLQPAGGQQFAQTAPPRPQTVPHGGSASGESRISGQTHADKPKYYIQPAAQQKKLVGQQLMQNQVKPQTTEKLLSFEDIHRTRPNHPLKNQQKPSHVQQNHVKMGQNLPIQQAQIKLGKVQQLHIQLAQPKDTQMHPARVQAKIQQPLIQSGHMQQARAQRKQMLQPKIQLEHTQQAQNQITHMQQSLHPQEQMQKPQIQQEQMQQGQIPREQIHPAQIQHEQMHKVHAQSEEMHQSQIQQEQTYQTQIQEEQMHQANLHRQQMHQAHIQHEQMQQAEIQQAHMYQVQLQHEQMQQAHIQHEQMQQAHREHPKMQQAHLRLENIQKVQMEKLHEAQIQRECQQSAEIQHEQKQQAQTKQELMHPAQMQQAQNMLFAQQFQPVQQGARQQTLRPQSQSQLSYKAASETKLPYAVRDGYMDAWKMKVPSTHLSTYHAAQPMPSMHLQQPQSSIGASKYIPLPSSSASQPQYHPASVDAINRHGNQSAWTDHRAVPPYSIATPKLTPSPSPSASPSQYRETASQPPNRSRSCSASRRRLNARQSSTNDVSDRPVMHSDTYAELVRQELELLMGPEEAPSGVPAPPSTTFALGADLSSVAGQEETAHGQKHATRSQLPIGKDGADALQADGDSRAQMGKSLLKPLGGEVEASVGSWPRAALSTRWLNERVGLDNAGNPTTIALRRKMEGLNLAEVRRARVEAASRLRAAVAAAEDAARRQSAAGADSQLAEAAAAAAARDYRTFIVGQVKTDLPPPKGVSSPTAKPSSSGTAEKIQPRVCILGYIGITRPNETLIQPMTAGRSNAYIG